MDGGNAVEYVLDNNIEGALVECGCGNGHYEVSWIEKLKERNEVRQIYMYDTFAGLTEPSEKDYTVADTVLPPMTEEEVRNWWLEAKISETENKICLFPLNETQARLSTLGYGDENLHYVVGDVRQTLLDVANLPEKIAVLRLDTDWYDSTKIELEALFPRVSSGGVVIFDDYNHWNGQREATNEYFASRQETYTHMPIDARRTAIIKN
jgi:hypothetical protein